MRNWVINKYLIKEFLITLLNFILFFSAGGLIMNLREEVSFFAEFNVGIILPIALSFMVVPSILINIFPFIIFLSTMWLLIKLKNSSEVLALRTFGLSNLRFVSLFSVTAFFVGVILLIAFSPVTSLMLKYYEDVKGEYNLDKSHLASITNNGVWVKEKSGSNVNFIKSKKIDGDFLIDLTIYKLNENGELIERIEADRANILDTPWLIENGFKVVLGKNGYNENFDTLVFESTFNKAKLNSIYSNLDTLSFFKVMTEIDDLVKKGYNEKLLKEKRHYYLSLPFFLILMVCLATIFTLNTNNKRQNMYYIILSIITCVIVFYFKNFSMALGATERSPLIISVWSPIIILTIFCSVGIIQINEK